MTQKDEPYVKKIAVRVAEDIEEAYGAPPNFIEPQALIQRFVRNNPDADPESIDWVGSMIRGLSTVRSSRHSRANTRCIGGMRRRSIARRDTSRSCIIIWQPRRGTCRPIHPLPFQIYQVGILIFVPNSIKGELKSIIRF
jgi:hypothetical protein